MTDYKKDLDKALKKANKLRKEIELVQETVRDLRKKVRTPLDIAYIDGETKNITIRLSKELLRDHNINQIVFITQKDPTTLDTVITIENKIEKIS